MDSMYTQSLQAILQLANSKKITEKKEFIENLSNRLANNRDVVSEITKCSKSQGLDEHHGISWNNIFIKCHHFIVEETRKTTTSCAKSIIKLLNDCCSLLLDVVRHASQPSIVYLKFNDLLSIIYEVFENDIYKYVYNTYIKILMDYILTNRLYRVQITPDNWTKILKICQDLYDRPNVRKDTVLQILQLVIHNGCFESDLMRYVKTILPFLVKVFDDVIQDPTILAKSAYKLIYTVCKEMAIDYRRTLCEFSETLAPRMISVNGGPDKYSILLLFVVIHHPDGATSTNPSAAAHDWTQWKRIIVIIYDYILKNIKLTPQCPSFTILAAEVFKQILDDPSYHEEEMNITDNETSVRIKRRRLSLEIRTPLEFFNISTSNTMKLTEYRWYIAEVFSVMIKTYPNMLSSQFLSSLLKLISDLFTEVMKDERIIKTLCNFCQILRHNESKLSKNAVQTDDTRQYWEKIYNILVRILGLNQNEKEGHELLQLLIVHINGLPINEFLSLYINNEIQWSSYSINSLFIVCEYANMTDNILEYPTKQGDLVKNHLINWLLNIPTYKVIAPATITSLGNILIYLSLKTTCTDRFIDHILNQTSVLCDSQFSDLIHDTSKYYSYQSLARDLSPVASDNLTHSNNKQIILSSLSEDTLRFTVNKLYELMNFQTEKMSGVSKSVLGLTVAGKFISNLLDCNVEMSNENLDSLKGAFTQRYVAIHIYISENNLLNREYEYIIDLIQSLITLYRTSYHNTVADLIINNCPHEFFPKLFDILNVDHNDVPSKSEDDLGVKYYECIFEIRENSQIQQRSKCMLDHVSVTDERAITVGAHTIFTQFGVMDSGITILEIQEKILNNLMQIDMYAPTIIGHLFRGLHYLNTLVKSRVGFYSKSFIETLVSFTWKFFEVWKDEAHAVKGIVELLPRLLEHLIFSNGNTIQIVEILKITHDIIIKNKLGSVVCLSFLRSFNHILKLMPITEPEHRAIIFDMTLMYQRSTFFVVQLQTIHNVRTIFELTELGIDAKRTFFRSIKESLKDLCNSNTVLPSSIKDDEWNSVLTAILYTLGIIIGSVGSFQTDALIFMLNLYSEKQVAIVKIQKIIDLMIKDPNYREKLIDMNLYRLMVHWMNDKNNTKTFPWMLTKSTSEFQFFKDNMGILILIKLESSHLSSIKVMCEKLSCCFTEIIEQNFSDLLVWLLLTVNSQSDHQYACQTLDRLMHNQQEFADLPNYRKLIEQNITGILTNLFRRLYDPVDFKRIFDGETVNLPQIYLPNFNHSTLCRSLKSLEKLFLAPNTSLTHFLTTVNPSILQQVLLILSSNIYEFPMIEHKLKAFHQYTVFCDVLLKDISEKHFDNMAMFMIRDVSYTLLHLINKNDNLLSKIGAKYFYIFLDKSLVSRSDVVSVILDFIVVAIISAIQINREIESIGLKILHLLITYPNSHIQSAVRQLDTFPNYSSFDEIREYHKSLKKSTDEPSSLRSEIMTFLNIKNEKILTYNDDVLINLRQTLLESKEELIVMYKELEQLRGFTEDSNSSVLHGLIYKLLSLTKNSDKNMSLEIAKCLGQLGPANLTTMILHSENDQINDKGNVEEILTYKILLKLIDFNVSSDINLKTASSNAMYEIFSTSWGKKVLDMKQLEDIGDKAGFMLMNLTRPFICKNEIKSVAMTLNKKNCLKYISFQNDLWQSNDMNSYSEWIVSVSCKILQCFDNFYTASLTPICQVNTEFCEMILPKLVYLLIQTDDKIAYYIYKCINRFFAENLDFCRKAKINGTNNTKNDGSFRHKSMGCLLQIINFIRIQRADTIIVELNYLNIAKAAQYCSAYFSSIFYAELHCETLKKTIGTMSDDNVFIIDRISETHPIDGRTLQDILREAYQQIGEMDSIHGCGLSHLKDLRSRIQYYVYLNQWNKVMIAEDAELSSGYKLFDGMANALQHAGYNYLLNRFTTLTDDNHTVNEHMYEMAWRLSDWTMLTNKQNLQKNQCKTTSAINNELNYHYYHYQALKFLNENNLLFLQESIDNARISIIKSLHNISLECSQMLYPKLVKFQMLIELEQLAKLKTEDDLELVSSWNLEYLNNVNNFAFIEPILAQRIVMYKIKYNVSKCSMLKDAITNTYLELSNAAKLHGYTDIAARILVLLNNESNLIDDVQNQLQYQDALLNWDRKDNDIARYLMKDLISKNKLNPSMNAVALRIYGNWMAEMKSENPQSIIEKYYERSVNIISTIHNPTSDDINTLHNTYAALAQFADTQYRQINSFMKTPQYESLRDCTKYAAKVSRITSSTKDTDVKRALNTFHKQSTIDVAEYVNIQNEQKMYLELAIKYYLKTLKIGEIHNFLIFRTVSLWLDNQDKNELNNLFAEYLRDMPCFKFIPLIPQLAPHLCESQNTTFKQEIYKLLKRCTDTHPHHTLPILFALINTRKDYDFSKTSSATRLEPNERELGAKCLINEFTNSAISPIITEITNLADALIMLAYFAFDTFKTCHTIPRSQTIMSIRNYKHCVVPTMTIDVNTMGEYKNTVSIYKYEDQFEGVGGVNAPKKIVCIGTDGIRRTQLVKGKDDLKQDAVMQQVFTVMNMLLEASTETKRRKLNIRTYKVVPLSQRSGVLEWCNNTQPIISILTGTTNFIGMHKKYYPYDWGVDKCRNKIKEVANQSNMSRKRIYLECCRNLRPALHFFFMENFPSPEMWFERRLAYVRSVATNSMVGYILGLGDRHFRNILMDEKTAEVVHIDFGIAFEQGKVLPVPETVPFRLTRDMEAAMGVSGVEGVMRKCSEETISVLRSKKDIIITLLQVLLYDPLYSWAITPAKAWELQSDTTEHINEEYYKGEEKFNKVAERALLRIEQKLQGTEDGLPTSIAGQVERLLQEARDPANLSRLFCGWQAYL